MKPETAREWAASEFGATTFKNARWHTRLIQMGRVAASRPAGTVTGTFNVPADRQGAFGLLESPDVLPSEVLAGVVIAGARRCADLPFVYVPVDGSSIAVQDKEKTKGLGPIGSRNKGARGLKVITALMVSPDGVPLGIGGQKWWCRSDAVETIHHHMRPVEEKETIHWLETMSMVRENMAEQAPKSRCWFQLDREGDDWAKICAADSGRDWFTIRASHNRRVKLPDGSNARLRDLVNAQAVVGSYDLFVPSGPKRTSRCANMVVRAFSATLEFRDQRTGRRFSKTVNVVLAREEGTTPKGEEPIDWLLLTNRPINSIEHVMEVVRGYAQRWRIEEFHRTWKSGACCVEETQLRDRPNIEKWAIIMASVAVRIERLKLRSRTEPETPATEEFTPIELKSLVLLRFGEKAKKELSALPTMTLNQAVIWVAEIGGYTGKSSGGPPGSTTINRGLKEVLAVARALAALETNK